MRVTDFRPSLCLGALLLALLGCSSEDPADLVFVNGSIHAMDADRTVAAAVAITGNRITAVGSQDDVDPHIGADTQVIDLKGQMMLPGLIDSHTHIGMAMDYTAACSLHDATSKQDLLTALERCAHDDTGNGWLWGFGFNVYHFKDVTFGRAELDALFPNRPVAMVSLLHEISVFNSAGIDHMNFGSLPADAGSQAFERAENGELTGVGAGDAAVLRLGLFANTQVLPAVREEVRKLNRLGFTSFFDAGVFVESVAERLLTFKELDDQGELTARANLSILPYSADPAIELPPLDDVVESTVALRQRLSSPRIRLDTFKIFVDVGSPYLVEPFAGTEERGFPTTPPDTVNQIVALGTEHGFSSFMHVIGDGAARMGLDAIAAAGHQPQPGVPRHTLSHLFLVHPDDVGRFRTLDVVANVTPVWAFHGAAGSYDLDELRPALGSARTARVLPFKDLIDKGAVLTSSSDYPYSSMNPFEGMEVGVTRSNPHLPDDRRYNGDQSVSLDEMIMSYTANGAYQLGQEDNLGTIEVGKLADLVVLDRNLYELPIEEVSDTGVVMTLLGGRIVYERD